MEINFSKDNGLVPAIIQDATTKNVLMLGYMNQAAYDRTLAIKKVTFFSRSKNRLWTKGEESGNFLELVGIENDCDRDALLVSVNPIGPTCHTGTDTCWHRENVQDYGFLTALESTISERIENKDAEKSYVASLFEKGIEKVAQKVGEEAVEMVIEAMRERDEEFLYESADLLFHYLMLLQAKGYRLQDIVRTLEKRHTTQKG